MKKSPGKVPDDTSIPVIHGRLEKLVETPRSLLKRAFLTIHEVHNALNSLLRDDKKGRDSNKDLQEKIDTLPKFPNKPGQKK